jgi:phospholipase C
MKNRKLKTILLSTVAAFAVALTVASVRPVAADNDHDGDDKATNPNQLKTKTPIKHLVVVFNENRSFDHYFGTYPNALNVEGEPRFEPKANTQTDINNLLSSPALLDNNPNANPNVVPSNGATVTQPSNGVNAANPFRIDRTQVDTAGQNHADTPTITARTTSSRSIRAAAPLAPPALSAPRAR